MVELVKFHPSQIYHYIPNYVQSVLDVGCNVGASLKQCHNLGIHTLKGIEINKHAIETAKNNLSNIKDCELIHGPADSLPLGDDSIDCVLCSEVLEHVPEDLRPKVISEIFRVINKDGRFIMTVPFDGLFSWLDPANFRLMFPGVFSRLSRLIGGVGRDEGFIGEKHGVIWHHHFKLKEIESLLDGKFKIEVIRWRGGLMIPLSEWLLFPFYRLGLYNHTIANPLKKLKAWDLSKEFGQSFAYNVLLVLTPIKK